MAGSKKSHALSSSSRLVVVIVVAVPCTADPAPHANRFSICIIIIIISLRRAGEASLLHHHQHEPPIEYTHTERGHVKLLLLSLSTINRGNGRSFVRSLLVGCGGFGLAWFGAWLVTARSNKGDKESRGGMEGEREQGKLTQ